MRIAYEHADSFVTYPQAPNLSAKAEPIRKRLTYPRRRNLSASGRPVSCRHAYSFLHSWALLVAVWAARLGYHLWG